MDMGLPSDERATLQALIDAAAPHPVPADQALTLLQRVNGLDSEALGRLAYHALTGVDPGDSGDSEPDAPVDLMDTFPPFASEVLMRAICGPDHRRPTPQAVVIVLETVPAIAWPSAGRPHIVLESASSAEVSEPVAEPAPTPEPPSAFEAEPALEAEPESVDHDAEFRNLLIPSRTVPRFDPLSDPWEPEPALQSELAFEENLPADDDEAVEVEPDPVIEVDSEVEPQPEAEQEPEPATTSVVSYDEPVAAPDEDGMHSEFRNLVPTSFEVPRLVTPASGELGVLAEDPRRRSSGRRRSDSGKKGGPVEPRDRGPMLLLIAAIVVLILLAVVYFAAKQMREETDVTIDPQGASRVTSQPVDVRP
ncbi:MAG: hypothetical protein NTX33_07030 [Propionibacteriales bacterium]|nr:hypothetical protein [Propionibacteriales bacterium]